MDRETKFEIEWREELLARLQAPLKVLQRKASKAIALRLAQAQKLSEYESEEEAHDAYGYGYITWDEYIAIKDRLDSVEQGRCTMSAVEAALDELIDFMRRLQSAVKDLKWSALPEAEKLRIEASSAAYLAELQARIE